MLLELDLEEENSFILQNVHPQDTITELLLKLKIQKGIDLNSDLKLMVITETNTGFRKGSEFLLWETVKDVLLTLKSYEIKLIKSRLFVLNERNRHKWHYGTAYYMTDNDAMYYWR